MVMTVHKMRRFLSGATITVPLFCIGQDVPAVNFEMRFTLVSVVEKRRRVAQAESPFGIGAEHVHAQRAGGIADVYAYARSEMQIACQSPRVSWDELRARANRTAISMVRYAAGVSWLMSACEKTGQEL
jgi:hypothetical protein